MTGTAASVRAGTLSDACWTGLAATKFSRETTVTAEGAPRFTYLILVRRLEMLVTLVTFVTFTF